MTRSTPDTPRRERARRGGALRFTLRALLLVTLFVAPVPGCGGGGGGGPRTASTGLLSRTLPEARVLVLDALDGALRALDGNRLNAGSLPASLAPAGTRVGGVALDPATGLLWITFPEQDTVGVYEAGTLHLLALLDTGGEPSAVACDTTLGRVFVANRDAGSVSVYAATAPFAEDAGSPVTVAGEPTALAIVGAHVGVTSAVDGSLLTFEKAPPFAAGPGSPFLVGANPVDVVADADDGLLFVLARDAGTVSVVDPAAGTVGTPIVGLVGATQLAHHETRGWLYVAEEAGQVHVFESDAAAAAHPDSPLATGVGLAGLAINRFRDRLYLAAPAEARVHEHEADPPFARLDSSPLVGSSPARLTALEPALIETIVHPDGASVVDSATSGGLLYLALGSGGLAVLDDSAPRGDFAERVLGTLELPGSVTRVVAHGRWVYLGNGAAGVQVVNASDPATPFVVRTVDGIGTVTELVLDQTHLLAAVGADGLRVIDVRTPELATLIAVLATGAGAGFDVDPDARLAYATNGSTHIQVIDLRQPGFPLLVEQVPVPVTANDVAVADNRVAAVASGVGGYQSVRIAPVTGSNVVAQLELGSPIQRVHRLAGLIGAVDAAGNLQFIRGSHAEQPRRMGTLMLGGSPQELRVSGRVLHAALGAAGLARFRLLP